MSKARNHEFPGTGVQARQPEWMDARSAQVKDLVLKKSTAKRSGAASRNGADNPTRTTREPRARTGSLPPPSMLPSLASEQETASAATVAMLQEYETRMQAYAQATLELATARASVLNSVEEQLLNLSIEIASSILEREIENDPDLYVALTRAAVRTLGSPTEVTIRASKDTYHAILEVFELEEFQIDGVQIRMTLDLTIEGLGCIVENGESRVDMTLAERLRAIRRAMENERRKAMEAA